MPYRPSTAFFYFILAVLFVENAMLAYAEWGLAKTKSHAFSHVSAPLHARSCAPMRHDAAMVKHDAG